MPDGTPYATVKFDEKIDMRSMVESIDVEDHDRAIDRATIVFDSASDVCKIIREQSKVQISLGWTKENALIFEGVVAAVKAEARGRGQERVTVTAYDLSYLLKQNRSKDRHFASGKLSDALKAILSDYPRITVDPGNVAPDPDPPLAGRPWVKTAGTSDWDFIQEAADTWKARAFVEVNNNQSQFYFVAEKKLLRGDVMGFLHYCPGGVGPLIEFKYQRIASAASPVSSATVDDPDTGKAVTSQASPPPPESPLDVGSGASSQLARAADIMANSAGKPEDARPRTVVSGLPSDPDWVAQQTRQDPTRILGFYGQGEAVGTIALRAKGKVRIEGLPPWAEGDWYVHKVNHIYTRVAGAGDRSAEQDKSTFRTKFAVTR